MFGNVSAIGMTIASLLLPMSVAQGAVVYLENTLHDVYLEVRGSFTDRSGLAHGSNHQELPAFYTISHLSKFSCYLGSSAWTGGALTVRDAPPFWGGNASAYLSPGSEEAWCAWSSPETGKGIGVYNPNADLLLNGRNPQSANSKSPTDGSCSYVAPLAAVALPGNGAYAFCYYIASGDVPSLRDLFAGIRYGTADGGYLGAGRVKISAPARFASFNPAQGTVGLEAHIVAAGMLDAPWHFVIPVYLSMPSAPCPDPANGNSVYSPTS